jgi:hypothetical protein
MKLPQTSYYEWIDDGENDGYYEPLYTADQMRDMYNQALEEAQKDALRYQWLRRWEVDSYLACGSMDELDAVIDAAIAAQEQRDETT